MKAESVNEMLRVAREVQPDLWRRTEQVARIIAPEAFDEDWIVEPPESKRLHLLRLHMMQATALSKAQSVLQVLGVNTETDWHEILTRMVKP